MSRATLIAGLTLLAIPAGVGIARADVTRCASTETTVGFDRADLSELSGDTGWFPDGYSAQLRISGRVAGQTQVTSGLRPTACWSHGMQVTLPSLPGTGGLDVAYGAELHLFAKIDTTVLGYAIYWEGELPIPVIPEDLIIAGSTTFDPALAQPIAVSDGTDRVPLLFTDLISDLISVTGISGGLHVDVVGSMVTTFTEARRVVGDHAITTADGTIDLARPAAGFDAELALPVTTEGIVRYEPTLTFQVGFDVRILGVRVVDYTFFGIPLSLPAVERSVTLTGETVKIPLPVLGELGDGARVDFASGATQDLAVKNRGKAPLMIELESVPAGVTVAPLVVAPGESGILHVTASADVLAAGLATTMVITTNDPDHETLMIALGLDVGGTETGIDDTGEGQAGCNVGGSGGGLLGLTFVLLVGIPRRRR